jgi:hypothetical protein
MGTVIILFESSSTTQNFAIPDKYNDRAVCVTRVSRGGEVCGWGLKQAICSCTLELTFPCVLDQTIEMFSACRIKTHHARGPRGW